jgi:hypothetical protein
VTRAERLLDLAVASFRLHFLIFFATGLLVLALAVAMDWRLLYWVPLIWGIPLLLHYLVYKARTVDNRWVEERTEELHLKSYDRDHIQSIRSQHGSDDVPGSGSGRSS